MISEDSTPIVENKALLLAASFIGQEVYSKPYTDYRGRFVSANFTYTCNDGTIIHRPNHNMANIVRSLYYLNPVLTYLKLNGNAETKKILQEISAKEIQKIMFMQLFYTSGRKNELGFLDNAEIASQAREDAGNHFINYFKRMRNKDPFEDMNEVQNYGSLLNKIYDRSKNNKDKALRLLILISHELDLLRCYPESKLKTSIIKTLNKSSEIPDNRDLQKLLLYAQRCIIETGDLLRTQYAIQDIIGVHEPTSFKFQLSTQKRKLVHTGNYSYVLGCKARNDEIYKESTRVDQAGIAATCKKLSNVVEPVFYKTRQPDIVGTGTDALELIKEGNAVVRTFNGSLSNISFRLETEQLTNAKFVRPIRPEKLSIPHNNRIDLRNDTIRQLSEREYVSLDNQMPIKKPCDKLNLDTVSKQKDRGKPKNTVFQKKCSYSLVPKSGIFSLFSGRTQDKFLRDFISVGFLHNAKKMDLKGEKYCWTDDVRSSGIGGYFWLVNKKGQKPTTLYPGLQQTRDGKICKDFNNLKDIVNNNRETNLFTEMLISGSVDSLSAVYATKYDSLHILTALYAQCVLRHEYNIERPVIIMDGKKFPKICTTNILRQIFENEQQRQKHWWRRLLNFFFPSSELQLLNAIKKITNNQPFEPLIIQSSTRIMKKDNGSFRPDEDPGKSVINNAQNVDDVPHPLGPLVSEPKFPQEKKCTLSEKWTPSVRQRSLTI